MLSKKSILVVDDEPDLREILRDELAMGGAHVMTASSASHALEVMGSHNFDVVLSDLRMPGGGGLQLAAQLQQQDLSPLLILMTGFADVSFEEAYALGAEGFLQKPFSLDVVRETLVVLLQGPETRWNRSFLKSEANLHIEASAFQNQQILSYLGRGGVFLPGENLKVRAGQNVDFQAGPELAGTGLVRWVRSGAQHGRGPGVGVEFTSLLPESRDWVLSQLTQLKPRAYLPRGF